MKFGRREFLASSLAAAGLGFERKAYAEPTAEKIKSMDLKQAEEFVKQAAFKISKEHIENPLNAETCCIDGRRPEDEKGLPPECAIPGADEGVMANILAAMNKLGIKDLDIKHSILKKYIVDIKGGLQNLHFHTDDYAEHHHEKNALDVARGCGHFRLSAEKPDQYGLVKEDVEMIASALVQAGEKGAKREVLNGKHKEGAVIIIDDETMGLKHETEAGQAFIYNRALHNKMLEELAVKLHSDIGVEREVLAKELSDVARQQLIATAEGLAKGKNIYAVKRGARGIEVVEAGKV